MGSSNPKVGNNNKNLKSRKKNSKPKKGPLPMKLRALPQSFWQQPNTSDTPPSSACTPLLSIPSLDPEHHPRTLQITPADIDLLFSLFSTLPKPANEGQRPIARRGRPRKHLEVQKHCMKDEDPYVTSAAVPEVKFQKEAMVETKVLALMAFNEHNNGAPIIQTSYAQRLQDLAINL